MRKRIIITIDKLGEYVGITAGVLRTYLSHFTLYKYVKFHKRSSVFRKVRELVFVITPESLDALQQYLEIKRICGKARKSIKLSGIDKLRKLYEEKSLE
jgi:hypothetical protein